MPAATKARKPQLKSNEIAVDQDFAKLVSELREIRLAKRVLEQREERVKGGITSRMGTATVALLDGRIAILKILKRKRKDIDRDTLMTAFPEAYEAALKESEYGIISIV